MMERYCEGERFSDLSFTEEAFESCDFTDGVFVDCTFAKCELDHTTLTECRFVRCGIGAEQRTDGFAADNVDPFLQIADAYDLEALSYTRNGCFRYAQPGFEQLRFEYLKEHSLAIKDNVEHLFGGNIELPTPCYPSAAGTVQKVAYLHSSLRLQQLLPELRTKLPAGSKALMVTPCWLKIVPEWLNKGAALTKVMRECGIRPEEAAAFGDGENDLGMLKSVTHGYAMGNAFDSVL